MIFHNTKLINLGETEVSLFYLYCWLFLFPRREMQTTSRYASRTSASLGKGDSFIALRFGTYALVKGSTHNFVDFAVDFFYAVYKYKSYIQGS